MTDMVNHPPHYTSSEAKCPTCFAPIECIDITRNFNFNLGNVIKYLWRSEHKDGLEALKKAQWYLNDYIKHVEEKQPTITREYLHAE